MTDPKYLISHHGADSRKLTIAEMQRIYQDTHYKNLYQQYDQPRDTTQPFHDLAYHVLIGTDGWTPCRRLDLHSYHASNYQVNLNSVAICISGNYDRDTLSTEMEGYYREAVAWVKEQLPSLEIADVHRTYANKTCPGGNITTQFVKDVFKLPVPPDDDKLKAYLAEAIVHQGKSLEALQKALNEI